MKLLSVKPSISSIPIQNNSPLSSTQSGRAKIMIALCVISALAAMGTIAAYGALHFGQKGLEPLKFIGKVMTENSEPFVIGSVGALIIGIIYVVKGNNQPKNSSVVEKDLLNNITATTLDSSTPNSINSGSAHSSESQTESSIATSSEVVVATIATSTTTAAALNTVIPSVTQNTTTSKGFVKHRFKARPPASKKSTAARNLAPTPKTKTVAAFNFVEEFADLKLNLNELVEYTEISQASFAALLQVYPLNVKEFILGKGKLVARLPSHENESHVKSVLVELPIPAHIQENEVCTICNRLKFNQVKESL